MVFSERSGLVSIDKQMLRNFQVLSVLLFYLESESFPMSHSLLYLLSSRDWRLNDFQCSRQDRYVGTCSPPESCCKGNLASHYDETYDTGCLIVISRVFAGFMLTKITP